MNQLKSKLEKLDRLIGNTPLVQIQYQYKGKENSIYAKVESYNLTGSVKDRMAYYILKEAIEKEELTVDSTIVEATSGNTGISFCALGAFLNLPVKIYMPDWMSAERKRMISSFGAEIIHVSREEGGFLGSISLSKKYAQEHSNVFLPLQFENPNNVEGQYQSLGLEIVEQFQKLGLKPDGFVAGVGTGGTVMGVGKAIRKFNPSAKISPLEPLESPVLTEKKHTGKHRIAGISDEFVPPICDLDSLDDIVSISDGDSIIAAQNLAKLGLAVGISSGANLLGAIQLQEELGEDAIVCTVFADDNKKYLTTDLLKKESMKDKYMTKDLTLISYQSYR
ncbi:MAG: cysteine synthase family protein [Tissierellia bacterium]|nr:cysteine synthase family protein [Tissierellia bacterium]